MVCRAQSEPAKPLNAARVGVATAQHAIKGNDPQWGNITRVSDEFSLRSVAFVTGKQYVKDEEICGGSTAVYAFEKPGLRHPLCCPCCVQSRGDMKASRHGSHETEELHETFTANTASDSLRH